MITLYKRKANLKKNNCNCIEVSVRQKCNVIIENILIVLNLSLLYLDFIYVYYASYSTQVKKYII